ncbi:MAG TPA: bifunctional ornithine acetyltransferase/N-acetylglutamate synthase [Candidatus Saccharimonadales bacterium]|nr:bifunctional ornithine acetyltransferase/N-acetylglutamate synthase [Candidatus Saccharimonadales bacterium]
MTTTIDGTARPADATSSPRVERRAALPAGFRAGGLAAGIKASGRPDLALIVATDGPAAAAAVFTPNAFAAAPVRRSRANLTATSGDQCGGFGLASAIVSTSGCANAATGGAGDADQAEVGRLVAASTGLEEAAVLHLSTGIIGTRLPLDRVAAGLDRLVPSLATEDASWEAAAVALRTTDSATKVATTTVRLPGPDGTTVTATVSGIAKGVGMIHPMMATMLSIVLTDAAVAPETLWRLLRPAAARTWDQLSVDGDTSTNDTVFVLASGASGATPVAPGSPAASALGAAIEAIARDLARQQAADGEGATTLITAAVRGAQDDIDARAVARAVVSSSLVKAAAHGKDPNWGRIAGAAGNARAAVATVLEAAGLDAADATARAGIPVVLDPERLRISIAGHAVFDGAAGGPLTFDRAAARTAMDGAELVIELDLGLGDGRGEAFGCDLTEAYVVENSEYTT